MSTPQPASDPLEEVVARIVYSWRPKVIYDHESEDPTRPNRTVTWDELNTRGAFGWEPGWAGACRRRAREIISVITVWNGGGDQGASSPTRASEGLRPFASDSAAEVGRRYLCRERRLISRSMAWRMTTDRVVPSACAISSTFATVSAGSLIPTSGSRPVGGLPRLFCLTETIASLMGLWFNRNHRRRQEMTRQQYQARIRKLEREVQCAMTEAGAQAYRAEIAKVRAAYLASKQEG